MSLGLANPWIWPFVFLVGLPILLHFVARVRPPQYAFSSVEFLQRIIRRRLRVRKPQEWLVLLIRTLIVLLLAAVFLKPLLFAERRLAGLGQRRNVVLVVDATASMAYAEGGQTRFAAAAGEAAEIIDSLRQGDTANIVWLKQQPAAVFSEMGRNPGFLQDELPRAGTTHEAGDIARALKLARQQLAATGEGANEICIISDFQASAWADFPLRPTADTEMVCIKVGTGQGVNYSIGHVYTVPARPLAGEEVDVFCEVHNYSPTAVKLELTLAAGEGRSRRQVALAAWERATVAFRQRFAQDGTHLLQATVAADSTDGFPADNRRWRRVLVRDRLDIGLVAANAATAGVWRRALEALPWARALELQPHEVTPAARLDACVVTGYNGREPGRLRELAQAGCTVICEPARPQAVVPAALFGPATGATPAVWETSREALGLRLGDAEHPVFRLFTEGDYGDPTAARLFGRLRLDGMGRSTHPLLVYADGQPALALGTAQPNLVLWNLALDEASGDLGGRPEFLFILGELLQTSRHHRTPSDGTADERCGAPLVLMLDHEVDAGQLRVTAGDETELALDKGASGGGTYVTRACPAPGVYSWQLGDDVLQQTAVNFPPLESDLRCQPHTQTANGVVALDSGGHLERLRRGSRLWPLFLALVCALILSEGLFLLWSNRS